MVVERRNREKLATFADDLGSRLGDDDERRCLSDGQNLLNISLKDYLIDRSRLYFTRRLQKTFVASQHVTVTNGNEPINKESRRENFGLVIACNFLDQIL